MKIFYSITLCIFASIATSYSTWAAPSLTPEEVLADCLGYVKKFGQNRIYNIIKSALQKENLTIQQRYNAIVDLGDIYKQTDKELENIKEWEFIKIECEKLMKESGITNEQKIALNKTLAISCMKYKDYPAARKAFQTVLTGKLSDTTEEILPEIVLKECAPGAQSVPEKRIDIQLNVAKCYLLEAKYAEARKNFLPIFTMPYLSEPKKAEVQLYVGITYFEEKDFAKAKIEFEKVLKMPGNAVRSPWDGGRSPYWPLTEAKLHLAWIENDPNVKKVLFVGCSNTMRGSIPSTVTDIYNSRKNGKTKMVCGDYIQMGTTIRRFWNDGDFPGTLQYVIRNYKWDAVVFEIRYNDTSSVRQYAENLSELIRKTGANVVIYEVHPHNIQNRQLYSGYRNDDISGFKDIPVSYGAKAFLDWLGTNPSDDSIKFLYADRLHASDNGAYMMACCIFTSMTGESPEGLYHPENITPENALKIQKHAFKIVKPMPSTPAKLLWE